MNKDSTIKVNNILDLSGDLMSFKAKSSGVSIANKISKKYQLLNNKERIYFFKKINSFFEPRINEIRTNANLFLINSNSNNFKELTKSVEGKRQEFFRRINMANNGSHILVSMRNDLLDILEFNSELADMDNDMIHLFRSWFNPGFLQIDRLEWTSSTLILESLIADEQVHKMISFKDLKPRLREDKRIYAYFHPVIKTKPIIFIEAAFTKGMGKSIQHILTKKPSSKEINQYDTCTFYSINNSMKGLSRISLGNFLIKKTVEIIRRENPKIKTFCTLSPIYDFAAWVSKGKGKNIVNLISKPEFKIISFLFNHEIESSLLINKNLKKILLKLCAFYLIKTKNNRGKPEDKVANFHLGNGALIADIIWNGDISNRGKKSSFGIMVNYEYKLSKVEEYHELFFVKNIITYSNKVKDMLYS